MTPEPTWTSTINSDPFVAYLAVSPTQSNQLFAGGDGLQKSVDAGASWQNVPGLPSGWVTHITVDPRLASRVFVVIYDPASGQDSVYKSTNASSTWAFAGSGLPENVTTLQIDSGDSDIVYAGTDEGLFRSRDGGISWQPHPQTQHYSIGSVAVDPQVSGRVAMGGAGFSVRQIYFDDEYENLGGGASDDQCSGGPILSGERQRHHHCDADWLRFAATAGSTYRIETIELSATSDTEISVEASCSGSSLAFDDDGGPGFASRLDFTAPHSGDFDLWIGQYTDSYEEGDTYSVRLRDITGLLFEDGFEAGDASAWSSTAP